MKAQPIRRWDREIALLAWLTTCVSILSFSFYFHRGEILLYGDAVAHNCIARSRRFRLRGNHSGAYTGKCQDKKQLRRHQHPMLSPCLVRTA